MPDLADGETVEIQGSAKKPYVIKNIGGVYSCTCPAWRNQSLGIEQRTCKHIRKLRGDEAETARVGSAPPPRKKSAAKKDGPPLLLAHTWENDVELADWWMSEKLDGVRAYWDGKRFLSRQGNEYHAPDWFIDGLPETPLDGELWMERKAFQRTVSVVRRQDKSDHWKEIRYLVFDAPAVEEPFEDRLAYVSERVTEVDSEYVQLLEHERCRGLDHLRKELERVESLGGEGLMLRQPGSTYEAGRSTTLLKVKTFHDADAVVVDHAAGRGRHKGRMGSLVVRLDDGTEFNVGTGFSDKQRENPPAVGATITFRYQELSDGGVPRFPSFVRVRNEAGTTPPEPERKTKSRASTKKTAAKASAEKAISKKSAGRSTSTKKEPTVSTSSTGETPRYFEYVDEKSSKFWEISRDETDVTVRYGRIGTNGQTKTKSFDDESKASAHMEKLIGEKTKKGYEETDRPE